jgi:hypothetical protein
MANPGGKRKLRNGLTQNENKFKNKILEQIASGKPVNGTQAALEVYDTKDPAAAGQIAYTKLKKVEIREQIENAMESQGLSMDVVLREMKTIAVSVPAKITGDTKLRSLIEITKLLGGYPDKKSMHFSLNLKGKVGSMDFKEAKTMYDKMNAEVGELVNDTDPQDSPIV